MRLCANKGVDEHSVEMPFAPCRRRPRNRVNAEGCCSLVFVCVGCSTVVSVAFILKTKTATVISRFCHLPDSHVMTGDDGTPTFLQQPCSYPLVIASVMSFTFESRNEVVG
jgi:hypothetical protein